MLGLSKGIEPEMRAFMKKLFVLLSLVSAVTATSVMAEAPIKIGFLFILSSRVADFGVVAKQGAELAIDEINQAGGVGGRKIVSLYEDEFGDKEAVANAYRKLVNQDKVDCIMGLISSKNAEELIPVIKASKTPLIVTTAITPVITGAACNRYTFRVTWTAENNLKTAAKVASTLKAKKWTTVGPDFSLGYESWDLFQKHLKAIKPDAKFAAKSEAQFAPLTNKDWTPQINELMKSDADGVLMSIWGGNFVDFVKQANAAGFFDGKREVILTTVAVNSFVSLGTELPPGIWTVTPYWQTAPSKLNAGFVKAYEARFKTEPAYQAAFAYAAVKAYAAAVEKAGSADKEAIVNALEGLTFEAPAGRITIRKEDHQAEFDAVAGKTASALSVNTGRKAFRNLDPLIVFPAHEVAIPVSETGCNMQ